MNEQTPRRPTPRGNPSAPELLVGRRLRGANVHHRASVFVQRVDLGILDGLDTGDVGPEFGPSFIARFADLSTPRLWPSLSADTIAALEGDGDIPLVELLLQAILAVERSAACIVRRLDPLEFARVVRTGAGPGIVDLVWESSSATISRAAANVAFAGLLELLPQDRGGRNMDPARDFATSWAALRRRCLRRQQAATTAVLALAAKRRGIPHEVLAGNYLRLGEGTQQHVVSDSALGGDARLQNAVHPEERIPPPRWKYGRQRLHRLLVLGGRVVSALRIDPPVIAGNGTDTIAQLVASAADRPRRDGGRRAPISLDPPLRAYLEDRGLRPEDVLPRGKKVTLECVVAVENGATAVDVTDQMHEDVREAAVDAAVARGWPQAVVDVRTANIARSSKKGRGRVTRIEPWPDLFLHALPDHGRSAAVTDAALDLVFPKGATGQIPTVLVVGERGTMALARSLDRYLRASCTGIGLALRDRTTIDGQRVERTLLGRQGGTDFLLRDPRVAAVISAASPRKVVARGLRFDRCSVIALLDPEPGGNADAYRTALEVGLAAASGTVVISADNPYVEFVLGRLEPSRVLLVTTRRRHPVVARHIAVQGAVVMPTPGRGAATIELRRAGRTLATVPVGSLRRAKKAPNPRALRRALNTAALAFGLTPDLLGRTQDQAIASADLTDRKGAGISSERIPHGAESPGTRRASRSDGSCPSAGAGPDAPYRNRR